MKNTQKKTKLTIFLLLFGSLLTISILGIFSDNISTRINTLPGEKLNPITQVKSSTSWSNFTHIHITGSDWSTVENYDWVQGNGSWDNPYIIENITIDAGSSPTGSGILIESSTSVYFIIRNCVVTNSISESGWYGGIKLLNTNNGKLINNDCSHNDKVGIVLSGSSNNTVEANIVDYNIDPATESDQGYGIVVADSSYNNTIHNNHAFYNKRDGIIVYTGSAMNNLTYNNCSHNGRTGIHLLYCGSDNIVANNQLTENAGTQVSKANLRVDGSHGNFLWYNNASNGQSGTHGIHINSAHDNELLGNIANNNAGRGIYLYNSDYNKLHSNTANSNQYGIYLYSSSDYNEIYYNTYQDNTYEDLYISGGVGNDVKELIIEGPILSDLVEITDPLEYGNMMTIQINATDSEGVSSVLIELSGVNYTMTNIGGDIWGYNWIPSSLGIKPYIIWANDSLGYWNSLSDSFTVQDTTAPTILNISTNATLLEAGEILKINVNATDLSGVDTVLFEILGTKYPMMNIGGDQWEFNWTSYSNGTLPYTIWINDTLNNLNSNTSSIVVQDTVAPSFSGLYKSADTLQVWDTLTIQADITDVGGVDTVLFEIAGTNFTMYEIGEDKWEYNWTADTLGDLPFTVWVNDSGGNTNSMLDSVTVQDTISPIISDLSESADPMELGNTFLVQANITDNYLIDEVLIELLGANHSMTNIGGDIWEYSWEPSSAGTYPYTIWVNDTAGNSDWIDDAVDVQAIAVPSMSDLSESADPLELGNILTIQINITDLSGIDTVLMDLQGINHSMSNVGGDIWEFVWTPSSIGFYPYTIWANDTLGNMNSTSDDITVQDTTAPNIFNLHENFNPLEIGYDFIVQVNITDLSGVNTTLIEINETNYLMTNVEGDLWEFIWEPPSADTYPYTIWANDSVGNFNFIAYELIVQDNAIPNLSDLIEDSDPLELGKIFNITINITDISGIHTTLIEIEGINETMTNIGGTIWEYSWTPSSIGTYPYRIWCNDTLGNWNSTSNDFTVQDTIGPTFNDLFESSDPLEYGDEITISININDYSAVSSALFEFSGQNHTMIKINATSWQFSWEPSATGTLNYKIRANDTHNHWAYFSESINIQDTTGPNLFDLFKSAEKVYLDNYITIRIKTNDLSGIDTLLVELLGVNYSMDLIAGELWEYNWKSTSTGTISFTIWANDTFGNWNSVSNSFVVEALSNGGPEEEPPDPIIIIIIIIVIVGATLSVSGYAIRSSQKKKSAQVPRKKIPLNDAAAKKRARMMERPTAQVKKEAQPVKLKAKKKGASEEVAKPLTPQEKAELAETEKEVGVAKPKFICVVHRGSLHGSAIYLCKHCDTFYCERCAKVLKLKGEKCWTCGNEIDVAISEKDRQELLRKSARELVEEIIQEKEGLKEFIDSNKDLRDIPQLREYIFGVFTSEELDKIDLLDFTVEEKKQFLKEYIALDDEERKSYLNELLQK